MAFGGCGRLIFAPGSWMDQRSIVLLPGLGRLLVFLVLVGIGFQASAPARAEENGKIEPPVSESVLIHCPGIAGSMPIDQSLVEGLIRGGVASQARIFDWTGEFRGLLALGKLHHNRQQARVLAQEIESIYRKNPETRVILTAHSGGTGIAVWALEQLADRVRIDTLVLLASALSPNYDLGPALKHVRQAYSFHSPYDNWVLGTGTRTLGTIDRVKTDAAGYVGFQCTDPKLKQIGYDPRWIRFGNSGDHVGTMNQRFAHQVLAPLILNSSLVGTLSTQPSETP